MGERKFSEWRGITCSSFDQGKTFSAVVANAKVHSSFQIFCVHMYMYGDMVRGLRKPIILGLIGAFR